MPQSTTYLWPTMNAPEQSFELGTPEPLVAWANAPKITDLKQDLADSRPIHATQQAKIDEWLDNLHVKGKALVKTSKGSSKIVPKLIRKQAEWRYAALSEPFLSSDDVFNVRPVSWEDREAAQQNELVLNHQFNTQLDKVRLIDSYVRTVVNEGTVIAKIGWSFVQEDEEIQVPVVEYVPDPNYAGPMDALTQMEAESPSGNAGSPPDLGAVWRAIPPKCHWLRNRNPQEDTEELPNS
jgi:hypothetical protein